MDIKINFDDGNGWQEANAASYDPRGYHNLYINNYSGHIPLGPSKVRSIGIIVNGVERGFPRPWLFMDPSLTSDNQMLWRLTIRSRKLFVGKDAFKKAKTVHIPITCFEDINYYSWEEQEDEDNNIWYTYVDLNNKLGRLEDYEAAVIDGRLYKETIIGKR